MTWSNRDYTDEFKNEAVKLAINSPSVTSIANDLGIPGATLHTWVLKAKQRGEFTTQNSGEPVNIGELIEENQQYIEGYYNQKKLHSAIDYRAPVEVEYAC